MTRRNVFYGLTLLAMYFTFGQNDKNPAMYKYDVPKTIEVNSASYTNHQGEKVYKYTDHSSLEQIVHTDSVDFEEDFRFETNDYVLDKHSDGWLSRQIGGLLSVPRKLLYLDWDMGQGLDGERSRAVLASLENNKDDLGDVTVRLNHNEVFADIARLFFDDDIKERNNLFSRIVVGVPYTFLGEFISEVGRFDYYNSMTQTVVGYSNVEAFTFQKIGRHNDFMRFDSDWMYSLATMFPPAMLYQSYKGVEYADSVLSEKDSDQTARYLAPFLLSYVIFGAAANKRWQEQFKKKDSLSHLPKVYFASSYVKDLASFGASLAAYSLAKDSGLSPTECNTVFAGTLISTYYVGKKIIDSTFGRS